MKYKIDTYYDNEIVRSYESRFLDESQVFFQKEVEAHRRAQTYDIRIVYYLTEEGVTLGLYDLHRRMDQK